MGNILSFESTEGNRKLVIRAAVTTPQKLTQSYPADRVDIPCGPFSTGSHLSPVLSLAESPPGQWSHNHLTGFGEGESGTVRAAITKNNIFTANDKESSS
jgi:hypothetical protein